LADKDQIFFFEKPDEQWSEGVVMLCLCDCVCGAAGDVLPRQRWTASSTCRAVY